MATDGTIVHLDNTRPPLHPPVSLMRSKRLQVTCPRLGLLCEMRELLDRSWQGYLKLPHPDGYAYPMHEANTAIVEHIQDVGQGRESVVLVNGRDEDALNQ